MKTVYREDDCVDSNATGTPQKKEMLHVPRKPLPLQQYKIIPQNLGNSSNLEEFFEFEDFGRKKMEN
jgi:hypothetical protein